MGYYDWPAYVPVAQRRAKAEKQLEKMKKKGVAVQPVALSGRKIAASFWGKGWCEHMESFSDYANRLPRGRSDVRNGSVSQLENAAGRITALEKLAEDPPAKARVRQLATAGAFHTHFMAPAQEAYAAAAAAILPSEPVTTLLSNFDGTPVASGADAMEKLVNQLTSPVRWDLCTEYFKTADVQAVVELPPSGALAGIAKREMRGVTNQALKSLEDLDALAEL